MEIHMFSAKSDMGRAAARRAAVGIQDAIRRYGEANLVLATGASQFEMLAELARDPLPWHLVNVFHLDEYIGLAESHPASFRRYLRERFVDKVLGLKAFFGVAGDADDPQRECDRLSTLMKDRRIDVACIGIGENGHLAFNDPPADFETDVPYLVVQLDEVCRRQQLKEGWFSTFDDVPAQAISMSIRQILRAREIVCTVPDLRKAGAVKAAIEGPITPMVPASILQQHSSCHVYLDESAASLLSCRPSSGYPSDVSSPGL